MQVLMVVGKEMCREGGGRMERGNHEDEGEERHWEK